MADLTAELRLQYGVTPPAVTFSLELDARDQIFNRPVLIDPFFVHSFYWTDEEYAEFYRDKQEIMKILANGSYHVRLYAPTDYDVQLVATEPAVAITHTGRGLVRHLDVNYDVKLPDEIGFNVLTQDDIKRGFINFFGTPPTVRPAPPNVEFVGIREHVVLDTITFEAQQIAHLKYNYVDKGFEIAYQSEFLDVDGNRAPRPEFREDMRCAFVSSKPVTGALVLRYPVRYRLYKVNYGAPSGSEFPEVQKAFLRGDINKFPLPAVRVFAFARGRGRVADTQFAREFFPSGAGLMQWLPTRKEDIGKSNQLSEHESDRVTRTLTVGDVEVDVEDKTAVTLFDGRGNPHKWFFQQ